VSAPAIQARPPNARLPLTLLALNPFADTRTFAVVLVAPVAVQAKLPLFGAVAASVV